MSRRPILLCLTFLICFFWGIFAVANSASAQAVTILHSFGDGTVANDGTQATGMILGADGNFYGITFSGGKKGEGTIFEYNTTTQTETILHSFDDGTVADDGLEPSVLIQGYDGNFYGTTSAGGVPKNPLSQGQGTIFEYNPSTKQETLRHSFGDGTVANDGLQGAGIMQASDGNLYGTTFSGGAANQGTIFQFNLTTGTLTIVHSFGDGSTANDGASPGTRLIEAADGNLYGVTGQGGSTANGAQSPGHGTLFEYNTTTGQVTILHSFDDGSVTNDALEPSAGLIQAADGNFYGTSLEGGSANNGVLYKYDPTTKLLTILHSFGDGSVVHDGLQGSDVMQATDGNLYGTTGEGGDGTSVSNPFGNGTIFEYNLSTGVETVLHSFRDGAVPDDGTLPFHTQLFQAADGNFYGTTQDGGAVDLGSAGDGVIFEMASPIVSPGPLSLTSLDPNSATVGSAGFTMTVNGTGFVSGASVTWNGASLATTFISPAVLKAAVPTSDLANVVPVSVAVTNLDGALSNSLPFTINPQIAPSSASISNLLPGSAVVGSPGFTLTVNGSGIAPGAVVDWNGTQLASTVVSANQITASVPFSDLAAIVPVQVTVVNPGASASNSLTFTIEPLHVFAAGLQLFSVPYDYSGDALTSVLAYSSPTLAVWNPTTLQYALTPTPPADALRLGHGYWGRLPQSAMLTFKGTSATTARPFAIPLKQGWNMIGDPFPAPVDMSSLIVQDSGGQQQSFQNAVLLDLVGPDLFSFPAGSANYASQSSGPIQPYTGYWILASQNCTLLVPPSL